MSYLLDKRLMIPLLSAVVLITTFVACDNSNSEKRTEESYTLDASQKTCIDSLFSEVEIVALRFEGDHYPSGVNGLRTDGNYIFVEDNKKRIYVFDSNGGYVSSSIDCYGVGPGEVAQIMGWTWNPYSRMIELLTPDAMMVYDANFSFIESRRLPDIRGVIFDQVFDCSASIHYLLPTGVSKDPFRVIKYDSDKGEILSQCAYGEDVVAPLSMQYQCFFTMSDDSLVFAPPSVTYGIYCMENVGGKFDLTKKISLCPGKGWLPDNTEVKLSASELMTSSNYIPLKTLVSSSHILVMAKNGMKLSDMSYFSINRLNGNVMKFNLYENSRYRFPRINYVDANYAYALMEQVDIEESPELLVGDSEKILKAINGIDEETLMLLKYRFR